MRYFIFGGVGWGVGCIKCIFFEFVWCIFCGIGNSSFIVVFGVCVYSLSKRCER